MEAWKTFFSQAGILNHTESMSQQLLAEALPWI
jgi:hypothetical protein